jgi:glyoxylase-like metal-dependent hydrolase (beta-lactamase superfamily II)
MKTSDWFEVKEIEEQVWAIQEPHHFEEMVSYLLAGDAQAVLIDTGMGIANIKNAVEDLTQLPVLVVNTHSHYDHVGDNHRFVKIAIHRAEARKLERGIEPQNLADMVKPETFKGPPPQGFDPETYRIPPSRATLQLKDGDLISLGNRNLEVIHTPGHSPGSICLWDKERGLLFTGDTVYDGPIYAHLPTSDFGVYTDSLNRLCSLVPQARLVLSAHGPTPLDPMFILRIAQSFQKIAQGGVEYWFSDSPWGKTRVYELDETTIYVK